MTVRQAAKGLAEAGPRVRSDGLLSVVGYPRSGPRFPFRASVRPVQRLITR